MSNHLPLQDCEDLITAGDELQWRQVHPRFLDGTTVSQEAFVGVPDSTSEVSTTRSSQRTAEEAHVFYVETLGKTSAGTWAVSVAEAEEGGCRCVDDAACDGQETPGHSYIDLRALSKAERKAARLRLAAAATVRGCHHP